MLKGFREIPVFIFSIITCFILVNTQQWQVMQPTKNPHVEQTYLKIITGITFCLEEQGTAWNYRT